MKRSLLVLGVTVLLFGAVSCGSSSSKASVDATESTTTTLEVTSTTAAPEPAPPVAETPFHSDDPDVQALYDLIQSGGSAPLDPTAEVEAQPMDPSLPTEMLGSSAYVDTPVNQRIWVVDTGCEAARAALDASGDCEPDTVLSFTHGPHIGLLWVMDPAGPVGVQLNGN